MWQKSIMHKGRFMDLYVTVTLRIGQVNESFD